MARRDQRSWAHHGDEPLKTFPIEVLSQKGLEELSLYGCFEWKKIEIPKAISKLTNLRKLAIGLAKVESLPETLGKLTKLEFLDLSYAEELRSLPRSLGNLRSLEKLHMWYARKLKALPDSIGKLKNLRELVVEPSDLKNVPASLANLTELRVLALPGTVKQLPSFAKLTKLERLEIGPDALDSIADDLPKLVNLKLLRIWGKAAHVPDTIGTVESARAAAPLYGGLGRTAAFDREPQEANEA